MQQCEGPSGLGKVLNVSEMSRMEKCLHFPQLSWHQILSPWRVESWLDELVLHILQNTEHAKAMSFLGAYIVLECIQPRSLTPNNCLKKHSSLPNCAKIGINS